MLLCNTHIYNLPKKYSRYAALQILRCQTPVFADVGVMVLAVLNALRALSVDKGGVVLMEAPKPAVAVAA